MAMHADQVAVDVDTVRTLVEGQFPQWQDLSISAVDASGTVNAIFRIGADLSARFPLRLAPVAEVRGLLRHEVAASRALADVSPVPTPRPVALGEPGGGYPMPWAVQTWLPGTVAADAEISSSVPFALDLAVFVGALRGVDTAGAQFTGDGRGGDLTGHDDFMQECFDRSEHLLDVPPLRELWRHLRALPRTAADAMNHGDLTPGNVLVTGGRLAGVLDAGGFGPADPALDLVGGWHLLERAPRQVLRDALRCDDLEWERGRAWAFEQSLGAVWYYAETNPTVSRMGLRTLTRILEG